MAAAPNGCLGCNHDAVAAYLKEHDIIESRFTEVPEPRHAWGDIIRCNDCGRCWLAMKKEST